MSRARTDIGTSKSFVAETFGDPGQRTFRVVTQAKNGTAVIWMEKEQLSALALSVKSQVEQLTDEQRQSAVPAADESVDEPSFDFKTVGLGLVFDEKTSRFGIIAFDEVDREEKIGTVIWWVTLGQAEAMADSALEIVASGRPICALCHRARDPDGHVCPHTNGHMAMNEEFE